jgi:phenylacetic acid degradation operon negative regulatory protein
MLERGDRRIFGYRQMAPGDGWMLVLFSVPEQERSDRHRLRSRLRWLGCGAIGAGTWIGPAHLIDETLDVLSEDGLREYVTVVRTEDPLPPVPLRDAVRAWWNVAELDSRYARFLATHRAGPGSAGTDAEAFAAHVRLVDDWRSLPYLDPGLPAHLAPPEWRASAGVALFAERHAQLAGPAARHVGRHAGVLR